MSAHALADAVTCAVRLCMLHQDTDWQDAHVKWGRQAVEVARAHGDRNLLATSLLALGKTLAFRREDADAVAALRESCDLALGPPALSGHDPLPALTELAELHENTNAIEEAVGVRSRIVDHVKRGDDGLAIAVALERLAEALSEADRLSEARDAYQEAIDVGMQVSPAEGWVATVPLTGLAKVQGGLGSHAEAAQLWARVAQLRRQQGDRRNLSYALAAQSDALKDSGRTDDAISLARESARIALDPVPCRLMSVVPFLLLATIHAEREDWDTLMLDGPGWLDAALRSGDRAHASYIAAILWRGASAIGDHAMQKQFVRRALEYGRGHVPRDHQTRLLLALAESVEEPGECDEGIEAAEEAIGLWMRPSPLRDEQIEVAIRELARLHELRGDATQASQLFAMLRQIGGSPADGEPADESD